MNSATQQFARSNWCKILLLILVFVSLLVPNAFAYQGFGSETKGGSSGAVYHVTNLGDSGAGSLRNAVSAGNRKVVFDVAGDIYLNDFLYVNGPFITIDGSTAPSPGITLHNKGLVIRGTKGAHDVIVNNIRVRNASIDGIQIAYGAYNVVIDHVSASGSADGNLDITDNSFNVTVSWSIFSEPGGTQKNMLIKYNPSQITLHHNIFAKAKQRNPQIAMGDDFAVATTTTADMRNNIIWDWGSGYGTFIRNGTRVNVVNNFYSSNNGDKDEALTIELPAQAYTDGNLDLENLAVNINSLGNSASEFSAPQVDTDDACTAANNVLANAGSHPLDAVDSAYISMITIPACESSSAMPTVFAGDDQTIPWHDNAHLSGSINEGNSYGTTTIKWQKVNGPGEVFFDDASALSAYSGFTEPGTYVLRLNAYIGTSKAYDDATITVNQPEKELVIAETYGNYYQLGSSSKNSQLAQSFVPIDNIKSISLGLSRKGNPQYPIKVSIRSELNGQELASTELIPLSLSTNHKLPTWIRFAFRDALPVELNKTYFVVLSTSTTNANNYYKWSAGLNTYKSGNLFVGSKSIQAYDGFAKIS